MDGRFIIILFRKWNHKGTEEDVIVMNNDQPIGYLDLYYFLYF
jgi:hypothetical protein